jgi:hypothetical protein
MHAFIHTYNSGSPRPQKIHTHPYIYIHSYIHTTVDHPANKKLGVEPDMAIEACLDAWRIYGSGSFPEEVIFSCVFVLMHGQCMDLDFSQKR